MRRRLAMLICLVGVAAAPAARAGDEAAFGHASDIGRDVLVAAALGLPLLRRDGPGELQAGGSLLAALGASEALKLSIRERRPDGSDEQSFPSGHASVSFAAAATLEARYGWRVGLPAQLLATFVGVSRVEARKHYWQDVLVGAAIGEASGFLITRKHDADVRIFPWGDAHGGGVMLSTVF